MNGYFALACSSIFFLGGFASAQDDDSYAKVYSSPEAVSEVPQNLFIAKGLPPVKEVGIEAVKRIWESYRTPTPTNKLIPVRSLKRVVPPASPATAASRE
jgi:hypothetical protein